MPSEALAFPTRRRVLKARNAVIAVFIAAVLAYAIWPWLPFVRGPRRRTIVVYGFSILGEVMNEGIFPAFRDEWAAKTGEDVEFISSFSGSGTITNQIVFGVPAEVAILSLELDALRLVREEVVPAPVWRSLPNGGILNRTPFIILVRPGNPKGIRGFDDLGREGIGVVHPDPLTSGGAQWAILAEYGSAIFEHEDPANARTRLAGVWRNVVAQAASARSARTQFENGFGDALITYEQEALVDRARGRLDAQIVYPRSTILSEHVVVPIDRNVSEDDRDLVDAFVAFLWSERAQRIFAEHGFRSVDESINRDRSEFGTIEIPFTVSRLGGWTRAKADIVDAIWKNDVLKEIRR